MRWLPMLGVLLISVVSHTGPSRRDPRSIRHRSETIYSLLSTFITFETLLVCNVTVVAIFLQKNASLAELSLCLVVPQGMRLISLEVCWGDTLSWPTMLLPIHL